ncbi:S9 family peptidase [Flavobacterium sp. GSP27]|uniref:S9 family peptidase n=1 Tax=unclassified Flavobacterium TaxID=196869 RepID=UPI000F82E6F6|nr:MULTISPECIES: S9 family peptidase [unclassified Flavobacterium]RTY93580.1 S9 family peptidase [Flavobacterium sp. GSN2]RTZ04436.1 S9 family peptidase [Flavobacterium sp. GSP6]RTZ08291.1 S9 family peptidase [Flavobacterium sp. GSP27]
MKKISLLLLFIATLQATIAQNGTEPVHLTDLLKIKTINNVTLTKDGTKVAFTLTTIEPDQTSTLDYKYRTQIYSASTANTATPLQLTTSKEGAAKPAWSPDGKQLAFTRSVEDKSQVFILSLDGGESMQLTSHKYGANNPKWSPDGKKILFSSSLSLQELIADSTLNKSHDIPTWAMEKPGFTNNEHLLPNSDKPNPNGSLSQIRAYLEKNAVDKKAIVLNKLNFQSESAISSEMTYNHFFDINVTKDAAPRLLTKGFYSFTNADYTPDGKQLIFSGDMDTAENPDRSLESEIYLADSDGTNLKMILGEKDKRYSNASVSHSGKWLAFLFSSTSFVSVPTLAIMPINGTEKDIITIPFDRNKTNLIWSTDDKHLYFTGQSNGGNVLNKVTIATRKVDSLSSSEIGITSFDIANKTLVYSKTAISNPSELYFSTTDFKKERKASTFNDWVQTKKLSFPEKKTFVNDLGMTIEYWVMKPANYQAGEKYPLLLEIHGGPSAMWGPGEESMWHEYQYFCSKGYGVVYSNPRGSGGYGLDFLRGNINDWGKGPASDVLTALDKTIDQGWADPDKLLITGGSYAGYLTAWIISHDNRFKAACAQRGVYDLNTFFGEGNAWRLVPNYFGGYPWEPKVKEILARESPLTYVENIKTPFIIFHGGNDRRTGFVQGEMMYRSLKVLGRPVEYVVHPGATHEITRNGDNRQRMDQMLRTYEFFERWIAKK